MHRHKNKTISTLLMIAALLFAFFLVTGCQSARYDEINDSELERNWGRSFEAMKYNQTLNPDAPEHLDPPRGMDGRAAEASLEQYRKGFEGEQTGDTYNLQLDVGGISQ